MKKIKDIINNGIIIVSITFESLLKNTNKFDGLKKLIIDPIILFFPLILNEIFFQYA